MIKVARILEKQNNFFVARYGGEEFLMVFVKHIPIETMLQQLELARKEVEIKLKNYNVTISIGVSLIGNDLQKMFNQADKALYISKRSGRNRITRYSNDFDNMRK